MVTHNWSFIKKQGKTCLPAGRYNYHLCTLYMQLVAELSPISMSV